MLALQTHPQNDCSVTDESSSLEVGKKRRRRRRGLTCGVCDLPATYYHFGGAACESCRVFFRRAIQKGTFRFLKCDSFGQCTVTSASSRKCPACRFSKCLSNGMDPRWVMCAEERLKLVKKLNQSLQTKLSHHDTHIFRMYESNAKEISDLLSEQELTTVQSLVHHYKNIALQVRYDDVLMDVISLVKDAAYEFNDFSIATYLAVNSIRLVDFAKNYLQTSGLESVNIDLLIHKHWCQYSSLRSIFEYYIQTKCRRKEAYFDVYMTKFTTEYLKSRMSTLLLEKYAAFTTALFKLQLDEPCMLLLMIVCLLSTDNIALLTQMDLIEEKQMHFLLILKKYVQWRYGSISLSIVYPKLLGLLTEAQELNISMNEEHHWIQEAELEYVEKKFGAMNPFKAYSIEKRNRVFLSAAADSQEVPDDCTSSINVLRGAISLYQGIHEDAMPSAPFESEAQSFLNEEALMTTLTQTSVSDEDMNDIIHYDFSLTSWSPDEFDLSLCDCF